MFAMHSHTQRNVCKTCQTTLRNNLPNGILCFIPVSKYQDTNESVSTVTFKIFKDSLTFVTNDLNSDVLYMNKLKGKEAEPIPIDISSLNSNLPAFVYFTQIIGEPYVYVHCKTINKLVLFCIHDFLFHLKYIQGYDSAVV